MIELVTDTPIRFSFSRWDGTVLGYADCCDDHEAEAYAREHWPEMFEAAAGGVALRPLANRALVWIEYERRKDMLRMECGSYLDYERKVRELLEELGL